MKDFNIKFLISFLMKITFYIILIITLIGFILKISLNQETVNILKDRNILDIFKGLISLNSNAFFALSAYISALFPLLFALIVFVSYLLQKKLQGILIGLGLILSLTLAIILEF